MKPALPLFAAAALLAACTSSSSSAAQPDPCENSYRLAGLETAQAECRQALAEAQAPARVSHVAAIVGDRPSRVIDRAELLSADDEVGLTRRLDTLESTTTDQVAIVTVPTLGSLTIEEFGLSLGSLWRLGRADLDNGVLLIVAPAEHKVRIEVGCGLEPILTDERAATVVTGMTNAFRRGAVAEGIRDGAADIDDVLRFSPEQRRGC